MPFCSQGVMSFARRFAKAEVRGENPRESAKFQSPRVSFKSGLWCNSSISPCEGDGPGANPGYLTNSTINHGALMANKSFHQDSSFFRDHQQTSQRLPV